MGGKKHTMAMVWLAGQPFHSRAWNKLCPTMARADMTSSRPSTEIPATKITITKIIIRRVDMEEASTIGIGEATTTCMEEATTTGTQEVLTTGMATTAGLEDIIGGSINIARTYDDWRHR